MSKEVAKGIVAALVPPIKAQVAPRFKKMSEEEASKFVTALGNDTKPDAFTQKQWQAMLDVFGAVLDRVTASTPLGQGPTVGTGWKGDLEPIKAALLSVPFEPHGPRFWSALENHPTAHAQVDALATGRGPVCPSIMDQLPRGGPRQQILSLMRKAVDGELVADAK